MKRRRLFPLAASLIFGLGCTSESAPGAHAGTPKPSSDGGPESTSEARTDDKGVSYSLATDTTETQMVGQAIGADPALLSSCQPKFVATGISGLAEKDDARRHYRLWRIGTKCAQLKPNGIGSVVSDASGLGSGRTGSAQASSCAAGHVMVGISYGINKDGYIGGVAALCAPLERWTNPTESPSPRTMKAVGDSTSEGTLSCPQGSVLTGIRAHAFDTVSSLQGVCVEVTVKDP